MFALFQLLSTDLPLKLKKRRPVILFFPKQSIGFCLADQEKKGIHARVFLSSRKSFYIYISDVLSIVIDSVPFRPERSVPFKNPGQNDVVFVPVLIPARSGNSGQIPARTSRFRSGLKILFFLNL